MLLPRLIVCCNEAVVCLRYGLRSQVFSPASPQLILRAWANTLEQLLRAEVGAHSPTHLYPLLLHLCILFWSLLFKKQSVVFMPTSHGFLFGSFHFFTFLHVHVRAYLPQAPAPGRRSRLLELLAWHGRTADLDESGPFCLSGAPQRSAAWREDAPATGGTGRHDQEK